MNTPDPDSGVEYPHINTLLFGILDDENRGVLQLETALNEPREGQAPTRIEALGSRFDEDASPPGDPATRRRAHQSRTR